MSKFSSMCSRELKSTSTDALIVWVCRMRIDMWNCRELSIRKLGMLIVVCIEGMRWWPLSSGRSQLCLAHTQLLSNELMGNEACRWAVACIDMCRTCSVPFFILCFWVSHASECAAAVLTQKLSARVKARTNMTRVFMAWRKYACEMTHY